MRTTAIPAQVTTVEDRITGKLNLLQLILLCMPVFVAGLLYAAVPPVMHLSSFKISLMVLLAIVCSLLAVRFRGRLVLFWIIILMKYELRPRYHVFDKRSTHGRVRLEPKPDVVEETESEIPFTVKERPALNFEDITKVKALIENPAAKLAFETRKGGLYVRVTEIKSES